MKTWMLLSIPLLLSGCLYGQCLDGPCALEREKMIKSIKPYITYWTKEGMTEEERRSDSWSCGAGPTVLGANNVIFSQEQALAEKLPGERDDIAARTRLRDKWEKCMIAKGYVLIGTQLKSDNQLARTYSP